jgi:putative radical SAM-modified peptide
MENAATEVEVLDEGAEATEMVNGCCLGGNASARK